jgi:hypothetical protein
MPELRRQPLAFGMQKWGPLPCTTSIYLTWDGPGEPLRFCAGDPGVPGTLPAQRIMHPSANGIYDTVKAADKAARAFTEIGMKEILGDG